MLLKPLADNWPTLLGRLHRKAVQRAHADQPVEREESHAGLEHAHPARACPQPPADAAFGFGGGTAVPTIIGGEGTGELNDSGGRSARIVGSVLAVDGVLYATTPDNAWAIDARDGRLLWKYRVEDEGRHAHGQSRIRHVGQLPVHDDAGQLSGVARRKDRRGALAQADRRVAASSTSRRWRRSSIENQVLVSPGNDLDAPAFLQPSIPKPGDLQVEVVRHAAEEGDPAAEDLEEPRRRPAWRRPHVDSRASTIRRPSSISSAPAIPRRRIRRRPEARATTSTPARLWRSMSTTGKLAWHFSTLTARHPRLGLRADTGAR